MFMTKAQNTYLALGDSYTICEGLAYEKTWPYQLSQYLSSEGLETAAPKIIAKTGWRTDELIEATKKELGKDDKFDMVSLLIGVNNEYQGKPFSQYRIELEELLKIAISSCRHKQKGVFMLSIPDYSVTPFAAEKNKTDAFERLKEYNAFAKRLCKKYGVVFYDITDLSNQLSESETYLHTDKLHPNEAQYLEWINSFKVDLFEHISEN
jgi:lysophospholipase L1-like esterase